MSRYIDADALKNKLQQQYDFFVNAWGGFKEMPIQDKARCDELSNSIAEIFNAPSIDLVKCKNCRHNGSFDTDCPFGWRDERFNLPDDVDFCSYGER
jgi:hypothetical protein